MGGFWQNEQTTYRRKSILQKNYLWRDGPNRVGEGRSRVIESAADSMAGHYTAIQSGQSAQLINGSVNDSLLVLPSLVQMAVDRHGIASLGWTGVRWPIIHLFHSARGLLDVLIWAAVEQFNFGAKLKSAWNLNLLEIQLQSAKVGESQRSVSWVFQYCRSRPSINLASAKLSEPDSRFFPRLLFTEDYCGGRRTSPAAAAAVQEWNSKKKELRFRDSKT